MKPPVIIPAYQPGPELEKLVRALRSDPGRELIIVDDGSTGDSAAVFAALAALPNVHLLRHAANLGKGQALKTAFNYFLTSMSPEYPGVVTADSDGQHLPEDIEKVGQALLKKPSALSLGIRAFKGPIPARSLLGNSLTRLVFRVFSGRPLRDTQTGLRAIPRDFMKELLKVPPQGYEFELEMLLLAVRSRLEIKEIPIKTVYLGNNEHSHFNPLWDSLRVYFVFLRFAASSILSAIVDYAVFSAVYLFSSKIFLSIAAARLLAGALNFTLGKNLVFRSRRELLPELVKYAALVAFLMSVSYGLVTSIVIFLGINVYLAKLIAETGLFLASFAAQDILVFPHHEDEGGTAAPRPTDWDRYYAAPASPARFTRKITERLFLTAIDKYAARPITRFCELGGANSCFYSAISETYPGALYTVIDNNRRGLELLRERCKVPEKLELRRDDILASPPPALNADIVFSAGLIEHFSPKQTARAIQAHFACARPGGLVIISFPTPTWLYTAVRKAAELLGLWIFFDERPLALAAVEKEMARYGEILSSGINWKIILTQGFIAARASAAGSAAAALEPGEA
ncbi:MAG: hypothetical protein A2X28_02130 [Elusimicrobia bacterium GWA2_56_46]|nr:MAG: hypothetical protein A2X28_02130 [Elusimicrobia bacterium GWA2_56_46]OGR55432.1 MAG: hypothetical protein A2X39_00835 [Elusimicrobia bacterium GWC2_56_31]HBW21898.1 methyltransferase type 12 [Elusimicrobiota bacterium]